MEDPSYIEYFSDVLKHPKNAQKEHSPPPKPTLNSGKDRAAYDSASMDLGLFRDYANGCPVELYPRS